MVEELKRKNQLTKLNQAYNEQIAKINETEKAEQDKANAAKRVAELEKQKADILANQNKTAEDLKTAEQRLIDAQSRQFDNAGKSFSAWNAEMTDSENESESANNSRNRNRAKAQRELNRLLKRGSMLSRFDAKKISRLRDYLGDDAVTAA